MRGLPDRIHAAFTCTLERDAPLLAASLPGLRAAFLQDTLNEQKTPDEAKHRRPMP